MSTGINIAPSSDLTVGTTAVTSGTNGRVFFQAGGVVQQDANFTFDNTLKRLTLKAVGTAATDIPFVVQNSGGTANIFTVTGNNQVWSNGSGNISSNTSFGEGSLNSNTTGQFNTAFGKNALRLNTTGQINTAIGFDVLRTNTTGSNNIALGTNALYSNLGGGSNLAIGNSPLYNNTSGVSNIAIGDGALQTNTVGSYNTSIGSSSLFLNTSGQYNVAYGITALRSNTTGQINTAIGHESLFANTTGNNNAAIGYNSGRFILGGVTSNTITNNSVFLGAQTKALADNQTNQIVIGYDSTGLGSNTTVIGNSSTTLFRPYGNVAIGADSASARLDVRAQGALSTDIAFRVRNSADTADLISFRGDGSQWVQSVPFIHAGSLTGTTNATQSLHIGYNAAALNSASSNSITIGRGTGASLAGNNNVSIGNANSIGGFSSMLGIGLGVQMIAANTAFIGSETFPYSTMWVSTGGEVSSGANLRGLDFRVSGCVGGLTNQSASGVQVRFFSPNGTGSGAGSNIQFHVAPSNTGGSAFNRNIFSEMFTIRGEANGLNHYQLATPRVPSASITDGYIQYSNDITAGNAAPHFRTEAGNIIKLYQQSSAGIATVGDLVTVLQNLGLLS